MCEFRDFLAIGLLGGNQVATALTNSATLANGIFSVNLDFGAGAFDGTARWLEITVSNGGATQTLSPRMQVLPAPHAVFSAVAAAVETNAVAVGNLQDGAVTDSKISTTTTLTRTVAETNLVIVRGSVNSNGTVILGQGFTCVANTSTNRTVTVN